MKNCKLNWCKKQKNFRLDKPNENLTDEYYKNAEETLRILNQIKNCKSNMWLATQKYYVEYFCAYAILQKFGIKSEIHSCTIEVIKLIEKEKIIDFDFSTILENDKKLRIDNQYYLKNSPVNLNLNKLRDLVLNCKKILDNITKEQIKLIRNIIEEK